MDKMEEIGKNDDSEEADTMDRGVSIAFLVEFCKAFDLWNLSVDEVRRDFIVPITCDERCRFVDLPIMKDNEDVVGRADTYILYTRKSKFGDLVTSISDGADPNRRVWLDLFASRQWPCSKTDFFIEYAIQRCPSFLVFCPDPAELSSCSDVSALPAHVKAQVPIFRLWCLYQIYFAAMSNGVNIVLKCGHHEISTATGESSSATFIENRSILDRLAELMAKFDTFAIASVTFEADKTTLLQKLEALPAGSADIGKMNAKLRGVVRAGAATNGDRILHNAACGDKAAQVQILQAPELFIHKVAIAGYAPLLTMILDEKPDLLEFPDPSTGRTPLIHASWGSSSKCVQVLLEKGALLNAKDNDDRTALSYAQEFKYFDCLEYLDKKDPKAFYIKHKKTKMFVCPNSDTDNRDVMLTLRDLNPKSPRLDDTVKAFLFQFVGDQLQHMQSGKFVHPIHGRKAADANMGLYVDSDGERTSCYPFDYDPTRCLLAGGDNFFVKVNRNNELVWHKYWNTKDEKNPFDSKNGFEFEIIFYKSKENVSAGP